MHVFEVIAIGAQVLTIRYIVTDEFEPWGRRIACWCPHPAGRSPKIILFEQEYSDMAKGHKRGNREPKKPKQNKPKKTESKLSSVSATFENKPNPQPKKGGKK
ncbi:hypothetical protein [Hyphococcus sp. DH-69]|uniref:hypothetical protein n=1 Tax=Hyphococcus formosus TaxID=3143534 RepID=UPI00398A76FF